MCPGTQDRCHRRRVSSAKMTFFFSEIEGRPQSSPCALKGCCSWEQFLGTWSSQECFPIVSPSVWGRRGPQGRAVSSLWPPASGPLSSLTRAHRAEGRGAGLHPQAARAHASVDPVCPGGRHTCWGLKLQQWGVSEKESSLRIATQVQGPERCS